jgi:hypothetical protein
VQDEGNHGEHQQEMDQPSGYVKNGESAYPRHQQHYKQQSPNAHKFLRLLVRYRAMPFKLPYAASSKDKGVEALDDFKVNVYFENLTTDFARWQCSV